MGDHLYRQPVPILVEGISIYHDLEGRDKVSDIATMAGKKLGETEMGLLLFSVCAWTCVFIYVQVHMCAH